MGRIVYREDGELQAVYFPTTCVVSIIMAGNEREQVEVATIGNEGMVGVTAATGVSRALGRAVAQVPGEAFHIAIKKFFELRHSSDAFAALVDRYMYAFFKQLAQNGACNRFHTAEERCAKWLLLTHDRAGKDTFTLTQKFLGDMMGTRRANVNLALAQLREAGAIAYRYRDITVTNRPELESFSCPCYEKIHDSLRLVSL